MEIGIFGGQDQVRREDEQVRQGRRRNGKTDHYSEERRETPSGGKRRDRNRHCHCYGCDYTGHGIDSNGRTISATEASQELGSSTIERGNCVSTVCANDPGSATGSQRKHESQANEPAQNCSDSRRQYTPNTLVGAEEATYIGELTFREGKEDENEKTGIRNDCYNARTNNRTRHITLRVVHLFASTVLQFKAYKLENDYRQNDTHNQAKVGRNQVGRVEVGAFGLAANNEGQCDNHEYGEEGQFDIGAKDGEPFAELEGHDGAPGCAPDEDKGNRHFDNGIAHGTSAKFVIQAAKPQELDRSNGPY